MRCVSIVIAKHVGSGSGSITAQSYHTLQLMFFLSRVAIIWSHHQTLFCVALIPSLLPWMICWIFWYHVILIHYSFPLFHISLSTFYFFINLRIFIDTLLVKDFDSYMWWILILVPIHAKFGNYSPYICCSYQINLYRYMRCRHH